MRIMKILIALAVAVGLDAVADNSRFLQGVPVYDGTKAVSVRVSNPTSRNRCEVVEIDAAQIFNRLGAKPGTGIVILDGDRMEVPYQLTRDGKVLMQVSVAPVGKSDFKVYCGTPQEYVGYCNGRVYPERMEDLAWENDKNAWRLYGMPMDGKSAGFDVFTKKIAEPALEEMYRNEVSNYPVRDSLRAAGEVRLESDYNHYYCSYHKDHGKGMDAYTVGMTLGAGAPAVIQDGKIVPGRAYEQAEIIENGPLRFKVVLTQKPQDGINEIRTITQDKGSHLAKVEVVRDKAVEACSGIVVHNSQPDAYVINPEEGYVAYSDAFDTPQGQMGQLYIGCLYPTVMESYEYLPLETETAGGIGHVIGRRHLDSGEKMTYYAGTGWSWNDVPSMEIWEAFLKMYRANITEPLEVSIIE